MLGQYFVYRVFLVVSDEILASYSKMIYLQVALDEPISKQACCLFSTFFEFPFESFIRAMFLILWILHAHQCEERI